MSVNMSANMSVNMSVNMILNMSGNKSVINTWAARVRWAPRPLWTPLCSASAPPATMIKSSLGTLI